MTDLKLTFLGTGAGTPSLTRNVSSLGLSWVQRGALWLFDAGEGTQQQILRSPLRLSQLEHVYVTHLHGDHVFGLPGLLASRSSAQDIHTPVTLFGPPGSGGLAARHPAPDRHGRPLPPDGADGLGGADLRG